MTEPREEWRGHYERMKAEADKFASAAKAQRQIAADCRRRRDHLGALLAFSKASEFRRSRDQRKVEARKIKQQWGFR